MDTDCCDTLTVIQLDLIFLGSGCRLAAVRFCTSRWEHHLF